MFPTMRHSLRAAAKGIALAAISLQAVVSLSAGERVDLSVTLPLKPGDKAKGATLDRFGLFTTHIGGNFVRIYFDDLTYTSGSEGKSR